MGDGSEPALSTLSDLAMEWVRDNGSRQLLLGGGMAIAVMVAVAMVMALIFIALAVFEALVPIIVVIAALWLCSCVRHRRHWIRL